jgi:uncharacterized protein GlcG (DUF336 family)
MIEMTLQIAEMAVRAAQEKAKALGTSMTITVVDESGRLVLCARGDGAPFFTPETSMAKAVAAANWGRPTSDVAAKAEKGGFWAMVPTIVHGQVLLTLGGTPIVRNGRAIGGIGAGGGSGEEDQECSDAGAAAVSDGA